MTNQLLPYQQQQILHTCACGCGRTYYGHPLKQYATSHCRAKAARLRSRERESAMIQSWPTTAAATDPRCLDTQVDPTLEWLLAAAKAMPQGKFYKLQGNIPVADGTMFENDTVSVSKKLDGTWELLKW